MNTQPPIPQPGAPPAPPGAPMPQGPSNQAAQGFVPPRFESLLPCKDTAHCATLVMPPPPVSEITTRNRWQGETGPPLYGFHISLSGNHDGLFIPGGPQLGDWQAAAPSSNPVSLDDMVPKTTVQVIPWLEFFLADLQFASSNFFNENAEEWVDIANLLYEWQQLYRWMLIVADSEVGNADSEYEAKQALGLSQPNFQLLSSALRNLGSQNSRKLVGRGYVELSHFIHNFAEQLRSREQRILAEIEDGFPSPVNEAAWSVADLTRLRRLMTEMTVLRIWHRLRYLEKIAFSKNGWASADNALHYNQLILCLSKLLEDSPSETGQQLSTGPWHLANRPTLLRQWSRAQKAGKQPTDVIKPLILQPQYLPPSILSISPSNDDYPALNIEIRISLPVKGEQYDEAEAAKVQEIISSTIDSFGLSRAPDRNRVVMFVSSFEATRERQLQQVRQRHLNQCELVFNQQASINYEADLAQNPLLSSIQRQELKERYKETVAIALQNERESAMQLQKEYRGRLVQSGSPTGLVSDRLLILITISTYPNFDWWANFSHIMPSVMADAIQTLSCCTFDIAAGVDCGLSNLDRQRLLAAGVKPRSTTIENPFTAASEKLTQKEHVLQHQLLQMQRKREIEQYLIAQAKDQDYRQKWKQLDNVYRAQQRKQHNQYFAQLRPFSKSMQQPIQPFVPIQQQYMAVPVTTLQPSMPFALPVQGQVPGWSSDGGTSGRRGKGKKGGKHGGKGGHNNGHNNNQRNNRGGKRGGRGGRNN